MAEDVGVEALEVGQVAGDDLDEVVARSRHQVAGEDVRAGGEAVLEGAERIGAIPRGTHHWADFVTPDELGDLLAGAGMTISEPKGIAWSPTKGLHLSDSLALNYIVTAMQA